MDQIWSVIGQYAFPIVMCILMGWYVKYREDKHSEEIKETRESHKAEMDKVTDALNNNTLALQHLTDYMQRQNGN
ncbi:MAG: hypothetical protein IKL53_02500 [Lachnospiraceae bacterium]|nr:hypothetical protein [Lachnospiraceae bacterium]